MATDLRQTHFRFGIEELLEATHGWYAAEDTDVSLPVDTTFLLRFVEQEVGGTAAANTDAQFQYNKNGAGWVDITTSSSVVKAVTTSVFAEAANCTKRLSGTGTFETSGKGCTVDGLSGGSANDIVASGNSETECALQIIGADVTPGDSIQLRFRSPDWTVTYDITPTLTVSSGNITVTPDVLSLTITLYAPVADITENVWVIPGVLSLTITTYAPTIDIQAVGITVTPGTLSLTITTYAPSLKFTITPSTLNLTLTGFAPSIGLGVTPSTLNFTVTGYAPTITISIVVVPNTLSLSVTGYAPSLNLIITPSTLALILSLFAPVVLQGTVVTPSTLNLILTLFTPQYIGLLFATKLTLPERSLDLSLSHRSLDLSLSGRSLGLTLPRR